ncbi:hypothetical protein Tsubulata_046917 [Turnera subulata]|uniref:Pentacotripeptide-repeat region of PRORP domain-containing protein n=1 Tax=Turnera subulata TaxID=218843 RepID=A0A9Q0JLZ1_9ROSI|nr:hypothetical protein Tsubulata_046917 [Turnera subulata]
MARNPGRLVRLFTTASSPKVAAGMPRDPDRLYRRLSRLEKTGGSVAKTLNEYIMEGKAIRKEELTRCIKSLRKYNKFSSALQIMEWMEKRKINFAYSDYAIRLDLIAKAKGVAEAENYFTGLPSDAKNELTYGALLNSYCKELMTDKALAHFKKMDELKYLSRSLPFNNLMTLYLRLGQPEKVEAVVSEMKQRNVGLCSFSYNLWLQSYGSLNDIEGVERVLDEMKKGHKDTFDWTTYSNLATIYVKVGLVEKAESALKLLEEKMGHPDRLAYHFLISLYAGISNRDAVNRVWNMLKSRFEIVTNMSYLVMLHALGKLKDVEGFTSCFKEWESSCSAYDSRVANVAIRIYLEHDMYEEAEKVFQDAVKRTNQPLAKAREMFMVFFLKLHKVHLAIEHMRAIFAESAEAEWQPEDKTVNAFFNYFEEAKDVDGAEKFCKILKHVQSLDATAYTLLLKTYIAAKELAPEMRQRLEEDGIEVHPELESLLEKVCG